MVSTWSAIENIDFAGETASKRCLKSPLINRGFVLNVKHMFYDAFDLYAKVDSLDPHATGGLWCCMS